MKKCKSLYETPAMTIVEVNPQGVICYSPTATRGSYGEANAGVAANEKDSDGNWNWD